MALAIHPQVDRGSRPAAANFTGGTLYCHCADHKVAVAIKGQAQFNHVCGCTKCWKPAGALFSQVAATASTNVSVKENGDKLKVLDDKALVQRNACSKCGVHMFGRVNRPGHPLHGFDFFHTELSSDPGWAPPEFAAFVSSIIESGADPARMGDVRARLKALGLEPYDCLSPGLMDFIATAVAKSANVAPRKMLEVGG